MIFPWEEFILYYKWKSISTKMILLEEWMQFIKVSLRPFAADLFFLLTCRYLKKNKNGLDGTAVNFLDRNFYLQEISSGFRFRGLFYEYL